MESSNEIYGKGRGKNIIGGDIRQRNLSLLSFD